MVIHNQIASATQALDPDSIAAFATICGQHSSYRWLQAVEVKKHDSGELNKLFLTAYLLDVPEAFEMISARVLLIQAGPGLYLPGCIVGISETWGEILYITHDRTNRTLENSSPNM